MNKTTKGSLAAGAAAVLLLGGAGSLAYWTDAATVDAGAINSGFLSLDNGTCDGKWVYGTDPDAAGAKVVTNFVPGDVVSKNCDFVIDGKGDNLRATPTVSDTVTYTRGPAAGADSPAASGESFNAKVTATYTVGGKAYDAVSNPIDGSATGLPLVATIVVDIPYGANDTTDNGNNTQLITVDFGGLTVSLKQDDPTPAA